MIFQMRATVVDHVERGGGESANDPNKMDGVVCRASKYVRSRGWCRIGVCMCLRHSLCP